MRIVHPELAVTIRRDGETLDADALDAGLVGLDQDRPRAARDPQHLEAQGRHGDALGDHDHRHAADDAVTLGLDGEQAAPGRRLLQHGHVAQQPRELEHERLRLLAQHSKSGHWKFRVEIGTNGVRRVELRGYRNDATQALATVTEAAVRAALSQAK